MAESVKGCRLSIRRGPAFSTVADSSERLPSSATSYERFIHRSKGDWRFGSICGQLVSDSIAGSMRSGMSWRLNSKKKVYCRLHIQSTLLPSVFLETSSAGSIPTLDDTSY